MANIKKVPLGYMRQLMMLFAAIFVPLSMSACTSISVTTDKPGEILVCDGTWTQGSMFGQSSARRRMLVYSNLDATKILLETFGQMEGAAVMKKVLPVRP